jgi:hypothetical protein
MPFTHYKEKIMDREKMKRLQAISHRLHKDRTSVASEFVTGLKAALAKRGYRADLKISTEAKSTVSRFQASVPFDVQLGHPSEDDLIALVAQSYPTHEIDWKLIEVDSDLGVVLLDLQPSTEVVPVKSISEIPPEFKSIGTGLYKRAVDSTGNVQEIWTLKRGDDGLVLYRNNDDVEIEAKEEGFKAGDVANTPYGPGRILRFDDMGNAFVQVGNKKRLVAAKELGMYSIDKEKKKLTDYYTEAYGDSEFAKALTDKYDTRKKSNPGGGDGKKPKGAPSDVNKMKTMVHK